MGLIDSYRMRLRRKRLLLRAFRKRRDLGGVEFRARNLSPSDVLCFIVLRNEKVRLPFFLKYYRALGIKHFFIVDNGSTDGSTQYLAAQSDVSLWETSKNYKSARFGMDWLTGCSKNTDTATGR